MIHRNRRVIFRMTEKDYGRYRELLRSNGGHWSVSTWTDLCLAALREFWIARGSPEPVTPALSDTRSPVIHGDLFSATRRRRPPAATSAPTRPAPRMKGKKKKALAKS